LLIAPKGAVLETIIAPLISYLLVEVEEEFGELQPSSLRLLNGLLFVSWPHLRSQQLLCPPAPPMARVL
jgi:hypothetical protein